MPSGIKGAARRVLFPAAESAWAGLFRVAGLLLRPRAVSSRPAGQDRVLVIAPHPDDETLSCGGAMALHGRAGDPVRVLVVTDGGNSRAGDLSREEMRARRAEELAAAVSKLGLEEPVLLDLPEGRWEPGDLRAPLVDMLLRYGPTLVYAPSCVDFHPEHLKVAHVLARALASLPLEARTAITVRAYELQVPLTPLLANTLVPIDGVYETKWRALADFRTQYPAFAWLPRHERYLRALYGSRCTIEDFWEMSAGRYIRVMFACRTGLGIFRSIRLRPFADGLPWLTGLRERRRLWRA